MTASNSYALGQARAAALEVDPHYADCDKGPGDLEIEDEVNVDLFDGDKEAEEDETEVDSVWGSEYYPKLFKIAPMAHLKVRASLNLRIWRLARPRHALPLAIRLTLLFLPPQSHPRAPTSSPPPSPSSPPLP